MTLVGWWPLNETSGQTAYDYSGSGNHGTLGSSTSGDSAEPTQGVAGKGGLTAYNFDGSDDYVELPSGTFSILDGNTPFTLTAWVYVRSTGTGAIFYPHADYNWRFTVDRDGNQKLNAENYDGANVNLVTSNKTLATGNWWHIAITWKTDGTTNLFINGENDKAGTLQSDVSSVNKSNALGADIADGVQHFIPGNLNDVRIYNRALTHQEIIQLYRMGSRDVASPVGRKNKAPSSGVAYYPLDAGSGSTAKDYWGNFDGTLKPGSSGTTTTSGMWTSRGKRGSAVAFDGSDDYIKVPKDNSLAPPKITVSFWIKPDSHSSSKLPNNMWSGQGWRINLNSDGTIKWRVGVGSNELTLDGGQSVPIDDWSLVSLTYDDSRNNGYKIFINGRLDKEKSTSGDIQSGSDMKDLLIAKYVGGDGYFNGTIDDIRIYKRALKPQEIQQLYRYGTKGIDMRRKLVNARK